MGTLKKSLLVVLILFCSFNTIFSQTNNESQSLDETVLVQTSESSVSDGYFDAVDSNSENFKPASSTGTYVKMIFFLILIIAAIYSVMWFFKKKANPQGDDDSFLRRVSTLPLSAGKSVEIVTLVDKAYILGVTDNNVNLIDELDDKELIEALNLNYDKNKNVKKPMNFADVLDIFMPNGPREKNIYGDAEKKVMNIFKKKE